MVRPVNLKIRALFSEGDPCSVRVRGFGACMIKGVPFTIQDSFMTTAIQEAAPLVRSNIEAEIQSWEAFPSPRLVKYYKEFAKKGDADITVVQLGSSDVRLNFPKLAHKLFKRTPSSVAPAVQPTLSPSVAVGLKGRLKWWLAAALALALNVKPATPEKDYIKAIADIADHAEAAHQTTIILTPFILGNPLANAHAVRYSKHLESKLGLLHHVTVLNARTLLANFPKKEMLLADGLHLSKPGHAVLGKTVSGHSKPATRGRN